jgi:ParB-like chromosome segregation protein Spo0J
MKGDLDTQTVEIGQVRPHPKNVRQGDIGAISESLEAHGQYRAIVVQRSTGHILAGNHTWKAAKALGWKQISAHFIDCDDKKAMRILLADNRANDLATYDDAALAAVLKELAATDDGLTGTLFDGDSLDDVINDLQDDGTAVSFNSQYEVVIECDSEQMQAELLERLNEEGLTVRAVTV